MSTAREQAIREADGVLRKKWPNEMLSFAEILSALAAANLLSTPALRAAGELAVKLSAYPAFDPGRGNWPHGFMTDVNAIRDAGRALLAESESEKRYFVEQMHGQGSTFEWAVKDREGRTFSINGVAARFYGPTAESEAREWAERKNGARDVL